MELDIFGDISFSLKVCICIPNFDFIADFGICISEVSSN